jgi:hypothetical protein
MTEDARPVSETVLLKLPLVGLKQRTEIRRDVGNRIRLYLL